MHSEIWGAFSAFSFCPRNLLADVPTEANQCSDSMISHKFWSNQQILRVGPPVLRYIAGDNNSVQHGKQEGVSCES
jgi:hypothetical protein